MAWNLDSDRPIWVQLVEKIQMQIVSGLYKPGDRLPSVRELAMLANVNPNTMQKAFAELERSGLIVTQRTSGRTVTEDRNMIQEIQSEFAMEQVRLFLDKMKELGFTKQQVIELLDMAEKEVTL